MEYNHEWFTINRLCQYSNRSTEADYLESEKTASMKNIRLLMLVMGFTFSMFAITDYIYYGGADTFLVSLALRGAALVITIASFFLVEKINRYDRALLALTFIELSVFSVYLLILYNQQGREPILTFMTMMLFILTVFLIPNIWKNCFLAGCAIWAGYILFSFFFGSPDEKPPLIQRAIYLGICLASCAIFLYGREKYRRRQFATEKLLEFMCITDRLTGIYNRGRFEHVLNLWIKNMRHDPFCLLLFDIDNFKRVNDCFGHIVGDQVLIGITSLVTAHIRDDDVFARWGGEEFVILFGNTTLEHAAELADRLRRAVECDSFEEAGNITISIGVIQYQRGETISDFVKRVDEKMYLAKQTGKNKVIIGDPSALCV